MLDSVLQSIIDETEHSHIALDLCEVCLDTGSGSAVAISRGMSRAQISNALPVPLVPCQDRGSEIQQMFQVCRGNKLQEAKPVPLVSPGFAGDPEVRVLVNWEGEVQVGGGSLCCWCVSPV